MSQFSLFDRSMETYIPFLNFASMNFWQNFRLPEVRIVDAYYKRIRCEQRVEVKASKENIEINWKNAYARYTYVKDWQIFLEQIIENQHSIPALMSISVEEMCFVTNEDTIMSIMNLRHCRKRVEFEINAYKGCIYCRIVKPTMFKIGNTCKSADDKKAKVAKQQTESAKNLPTKNVDGLAPNLPTKNVNELAPNLPIKNVDELAPNLPTQSDPKYLEFVTLFGVFHLASQHKIIYNMKMDAIKYGTCIRDMPSIYTVKNNLCSYIKHNLVSINLSMEEEHTEIFRFINARKALYRALLMNTDRILFGFGKYQTISKIKEYSAGDLCSISAFDPVVYMQYLDSFVSFVKYEIKELSIKQNLDPNSMNMNLLKLKLEKPAGIERKFIVHDVTNSELLNHETMFHIDEVLGDM